MNRTLIFVEEIIAAGLLLAVCYPLFRYGSLEGVVVPWHFSGGEVDSWGNRTVFIWLAAIAAAIYGLLWVTQKYPRLVNIPGVDTAANPLAAQAMASALKMWSMALFAWLSIRLYLIALGKASRPLVGVLLLILLATLIHVGYLTYAARR